MVGMYYYKEKISHSTGFTLLKGKEFTEKIRYRKNTFQVGVELISFKP
jgi:hypothetical protein